MAYENRHREEIIQNYKAILNGHQKRFPTGTWSRDHRLDNWNICFQYLVEDKLNLSKEEVFEQTTTDFLHQHKLLMGFKNLFDSVEEAIYSAFPEWKETKNEEVEKMTSEVIKDEKEKSVDVGSDELDELVTDFNNDMEKYFKKETDESQPSNGLTELVDPFDGQDFDSKAEELVPSIIKEYQFPKNSSAKKLRKAQMKVIAKLEFLDLTYEIQRIDKFTWLVTILPSKKVSTEIPIES